MDPHATEATEARGHPTPCAAAAPDGLGALTVVVVLVVVRGGGRVCEGGGVWRRHGDSGGGGVAVTSIAAVWGSQSGAGGAVPCHASLGH